MLDSSQPAPEIIECLLDSTLESADRAEELALGMARRAGFEDDDLMKIAIAVRESVVNAVVHGNRYDVRKKVRFSVTRHADRFTVRVADEGEGFDPGSLPDPLAPENLMRTSGRGLFLIRSFMDEFETCQPKPGGAELVMVKHISSGEARRRSPEPG